MERYYVYGIGNALVDMEFEVSEDFLKDMEIEKGVMTLVDEERQSFLLSSLKNEFSRRACGGSAANTLMAITQLGGKCFYSCKVGHDEFGQFYEQNLRDNGVLTPANAKSEGITGKCLVLITPDADRTLNTFLGITQTFGVEQLVEAELTKAEYLYIEGYLVASPTGRQAMQKSIEIAKKSGVKVAISFSDPFIVKTFRNELLNFVRSGVDFIFCNEKEGQAFAEGQELRKVCNTLKNFSTAFAITMSEQGSLIYDGKNYMEVAPYRVQAVDSNGAGDMYAGAFLYGICHGMDYAVAGDLASLASARVVSKFGPRLEKAQGQAVLKEILRKQPQ